jgi:quinol monooxygenase YgiN
MGLAQPGISGRIAAQQARVVCVLLHYVGKANEEASLHALLAAFARDACNEEPGLLSYVVSQAMGSASHFVVHAQFIDWSAFEAHAETAHMRRLLPQLTALLGAPISMELFLGV